MIPPITSHIAPVADRRFQPVTRMQPAGTDSVPAGELPRFGGKPYLPGVPLFGAARYIPGKGWQPDYSTKPSLTTVKAKFQREFSRQPQAVYYAPGRFCVFSSHTDYNGGYVLAGGHSKGTFAAAERRDDRLIRVTTMSAPRGERDYITINLDNPPDKPNGTWGDYVEATARRIEKELNARGLAMKGANIVLGSDIDLGAGVSSSAALETVMALTLMDLYGAPVDSVDERVRLAKLAQESEHAAGNPSGYLDQASSALAREGQLLLMSCRNPERPEKIEYITTQLPKDKTFMLINTGKTHELRKGEGGESPYAMRRRVCEEAFAILSSLPQFADRKTLCDIKPAELKKHRKLLEQFDETPGKTMYKWALHAVTESERTLKGARALERGDIKEFGRLMRASHASSRDNYGISCSELEVVWHTVNKIPGVHGAQVIGGGFGGNILVLLDKSTVNDVKSRVRQRYNRLYPMLELSFTETAPSAGARVLWRQEDDAEPAGNNPSQTPDDDDDNQVYGVI